MQCDICQRPSSTRLPFNCTTCAQNTLYGPRIQQAQLLLETESIGREVETYVGSIQKAKDASSNNANSSAIHPTFGIERATAERLVLAEQTEKIMAQTKLLRDQTEEMKRYLSNKRKEHSKRRSDLEDAKKVLLQRQITNLEPVQKSIKRTQSHWEVLHTKTVKARRFLCEEAAELYGLQQRKRRKGVTGRDLYYIGGLPIPDLRDLNIASPAQISASVTSLAHLVHLVSHYLSLRLPAEITLPHRDYPLPTILSPGFSYNTREIPYPGFTPTHSSNNSPSASRVTEVRSLPRPRPLHIEKKLPVLAKEEPLLYASFVEGITLLAWDVAWVCKTQGLDVGKSSWEDICAMGKNLWQLILGPTPAPQQQLPLPRNKPNISESCENKGESQKPPPAMLGHFSHGTAYSFLAAAEGLEHMSGWRLQNPYKVIDRVKVMLQNVRDGAEWQLLEENEWEQPEAPLEPAKNEQAKGLKYAQAATMEGAGLQAANSEKAGIYSVGKGEEESEGRIKGTSGWTKLKSRGGQ